MGLFVGPYMSENLFSSQLMGAPQTFGGLGNLGGVPQPQPPPQRMPGMGSDALTALGLSLMGSPRNAPLSGFGEAFLGLRHASNKRQEAEMERAEKAQTKNATKQYLMSRGFSEADADAAIANPALLSEMLRGMRGAGKEGLINAGGGAIYDPNTGDWITAPTQGTEEPKIVEIFDEASGQPYKATWNAQTGNFERIGGVKARSGMQLTTNPDGTVTMTEGPIAGRPKLTEGEAKNAGFLERGLLSNSVLNELEMEGTSLFNKGAGNIPIVGNYMRSPNAQKYDQAKRDFINAVLRRESGAVISPDEFANAEQQYFPQPGDGPEVIAQKRANREAAIKGFDIGAGQGAALVGQPDGANSDPLGIR